MRKISPRGGFEVKAARRVRYLQQVLIDSLLVLSVMVVLFFTGHSVAKVAIISGAYMLFTGRIKAHKVYR